MAAPSDPFALLQNLFNDAVELGELSVVECTTRLSEICISMSLEEKKRVDEEIKMSYKQISEKYASEESRDKVSRELKFQITFVLHTRFLYFCEEIEACADHELSDWISELISRLSLCDPTSHEWKRFLNQEVVERYKQTFPRTLYHVYINLGLEPPECLPSDTELTASESRNLEENVDEVDGAMFNSPPPTTLLQSPPVPRNTLRQSLPRALFTDSALIPLASTETPDHLTSTPVASSLIISSCPTNMEFSKRRSSKTLSAPQLVLIPCQRSKRKCRTPTKRIQVKRETRHKLASTTPTARQRRPSASSSKQTSSRTPRSSDRSRSHTSSAASHTGSKHSRKSLRTSISPKKESQSAKADSKRTRHWRSVHETPNPEKSYPRWERAKLAAAEKTKNKAIIVDESPIKPLLTTVSPLRRLRRANSMLASLLYIEAKEASVTQSQVPSTLLNNTSSLLSTLNDGQLTREPSFQLGQELDMHKDSCLSVAMSRAERWRRRQLEEELSLSQFSNNPLDSVHLTNNNEEVCTVSERLLRRNSNLLANMISSNHYSVASSIDQPVNSPNRIKTPRKNIFNVTPSCKVKINNNCLQLPSNETITSKNPNPVEVIPSLTHVTKPIVQCNSPLVPVTSIAVSPLKSTPRRRAYTYRSKKVEDGHTPVNRRRIRHSSGFLPSISRETLISPQVFDEEAMFLGREEFLHETTPNLSSTTDNTCVEDDGEEFGALLMSSKRRKVISPICSPLQSPVFKLNTRNTSIVQQVLRVGSPKCHNVVDDVTPSCSLNDSHFITEYLNAPKRNIHYSTSVTPTTTTTTTNVTMVSNCSITTNSTVATNQVNFELNNKQSKVIAGTSSCPVNNSTLPFLTKPVQSPFAPLHVFNRPLPGVNDILDNCTLSSQSNSACIAFRKQLFGGGDEQSLTVTQDNLSYDKLSNLLSCDNSENINPCQLNSPTSSSPSSSITKLNSVIKQKLPSISSREDSRHVWDEASLDMPLSPVLRQLQWNIQKDVDLTTEPKYLSCIHLSNSVLFTSSGMSNTTKMMSATTTMTARNQPRIRPRRSLFH
ncbi:unnamed protein product [Heterobilharzia americana]|nr:unnamed protein product [Heterobilharzia americana]